MDQINTKYLIIGAGIAGLSFVYKNKELLKNDYLIVDRNNYIGGRINTVKFNDINVQMGASVIRINDTFNQKQIKSLGLNLVYHKIKYNIHNTDDEIYMNNRKIFINKIMTIFNDENNKELLLNITFNQLIDLVINPELANYVRTYAQYNDWLNANAYYTIIKYLLNTEVVEINDKRSSQETNVSDSNDTKVIAKNNNKNYIINCKKIIICTDVTINNVKFNTNNNDKINELINS